MPWTNYITEMYILAFLITGAIVYKVYIKQNQEEEE
jgi:hypothetical protein